MVSSSWFQDGEEQHGLKMDVGLILSDRLEFKLDGLVLDGYTFGNLLDERDADVQPRRHHTFVLAEHRDHGHVSLRDGDERPCDEEKHQKNETDKDNKHTHEEPP